MFPPFQTLHVQLHNQLFASFILKISRFSPFFPTPFHCSSSKFTTTTAQFPFYNCKLHLTTAQIVISCTLKNALTLCNAEPTQRCGRKCAVSRGASEGHPTCMYTLRSRHPATPRNATHKAGRTLFRHLSQEVGSPSYIALQ